MRIRFMLLSVEQCNALPSNLKGMTGNLGRVFPSVKNSLLRAGLPLSADAFFAGMLLSALFYGIVFGIILGIAGFFGIDGGLENGVRLGVVSFFCAFLGAFGIHLIYPRLLAQNAAAGVDQSLMFALKSLLIQVNSGVGLYDAMANVARSNYGNISKDFERVVQDINSGVTEVSALEKLALRTDSEFLKKTIWQLVTSIRTGSSVGLALASIMNTLMEYQSRRIKNYSNELNMWILMYLLIAAALPTIGITFMVILSSIGGSDIKEDTIFLTVGFAFVIQVLLIGFISTRAPRGYV